MKFLKKYNFITEALLTRSRSMWQPLAFEGRELTDIIIYDSSKGKILFATDQGWFEQGGANPEQVSFPEILNKKKVNLFSSIPFIFKVNANNYSDIEGLSEKQRKYGFYLFIPSDVVHYKSLGVVEEKNKNSTSYYDSHEITLDDVQNRGNLTSLTMNYKKYKYSDETDYGAQIKKIIKLCGEEDNYNFSKSLETIIDKINTNEEIRNFFYNLITKIRGSRFDL